jgi:eukaryotic-like serine/threonine-protein kinase
MSSGGLLGDALKLTGGEPLSWARVSDQPHSVSAGDILADKYRVERVLGQGGMGVVVLAEHLELRERVAIKFLLDTGDNAELAERFLREARAAVKIKSEHVVRVVDVGRLPTRAPYMVMEYLEGEDLSQRLLSGPIPVEDAVDYVVQSCEAMHAAHRLGIVHRDLKPANLFLTQRPDGSSLIKVLDFGISKVKTTDAAQLSLTHTQAMMGSPLYMSPEQMRSSKDVSPSADIWSLGVILHELIAGDVPFTGSTFPEVLVQVMSGTPPSLRTLRAEVPAGLEAVVLRCLEKDPVDRYSSVAALGVALSPFASSRTLGLQARLRSSVSRPPAVASAAGFFRGATPTLLHETPVATAPTAPAPPPAADVLPAPAASVERSPSKTNTAWAEQMGSGTSRTSGSRRRWLVGASALALTSVAAFAWLRSGSTIPSAAPTAPPSAAPAAAPTQATPDAPPPAAELQASPRPREPTIRPARSVSLEHETSPEPGAITGETPSDAPAPSKTGNAEPSIAPVSAPDEHTLAAPPTTTTPEPERAAVPKAAPVTPRAAKTAGRARGSATASPKPAAPRAPRPASEPEKPTRSKPLSIEFK